MIRGMSSFSLLVAFMVLQLCSCYCLFRPFYAFGTRQVLYLHRKLLRADNSFDTRLRQNI